jgi:hypothetical protein
LASKPVRFKDAADTFPGRRGASDCGLAQKGADMTKKVSHIDAFRAKAPDLLAEPSDITLWHEIEAD